MKTTNYFNTFIEVAEDCPVRIAERPTGKNGNKTVAVLEYELISNNPYRYTSDDVLFVVFAEKNSIPNDNFDLERQKFFLNHKLVYALHHWQNDMVGGFIMMGKERSPFMVWEPESMKYFQQIQH